MFTRAGFRPRMHRTGIRAMARHTLYVGHYPVELVRLACGDYAWYARHAFMAWGEQLWFLNRFYLALRPGVACPIDVPPAERAKWGQLVDLSRLEVRP